MMQMAVTAGNPRRAVMLRALEAYLGGSSPTAPAERQLVTEPGKTDDNVPVNVIKPIVNAGAEFLFGDPGFPTIEIPTEADGEDTDKQSDPEKWLAECFRLNRHRGLFLEAATNGMLMGTPFLRITTNRPFPNTRKVGKGRDFPRLTSWDPMTVSMVWDPLDIEDITAYVWSAIDGDVRRQDNATPAMPGYLWQFVFRNERGTWTIRNAKSYVGRNFDAPVADQDDIEWPYPWPPVLHWKNLPSPNQAYGEPDVDESLIQMQRALAFSLSKRQRVDRLNAHPKVVTKGVSDRLNPEDPVWEVDEESDVQLLSPTWNSESAQNTGNDIYAHILEQTSTPSILLGRPDREHITSGTAQLVRMHPIIRKTGARRIMVEPALVELCRRLLELGGYGPDIIVNVTWPELIPADPLTKRSIAKMDYDLGVKAEVLTQKLGYKLSDLDPEGPPKQQAPAPGMPGGMPGAPDTNKANAENQKAQAKAKE
jgi:hypothetical protein